MNQELVIREKGLENIDHRVFQIKGLKILEISKNKLRNVEGDFFQLEGLKIMRINDNILDTPPWGLEFVESLQELEFQGNRLKEFYQKANWPILK